MKNPRTRSLTPVRLMPWLADELRAHIEAGYTSHLDGMELVFSAAPRGSSDRRLPAWTNGRNPIEVIEEAQARGLSIAQFAREVGTNRQTVYAALRTAKRIRDQGGVRPGHPLSDITLWQVLDYTAERIGMAHFRAHDLRGSCASNMLSAGLSVPFVAAQLGDTPDMINKRYARTTEESNRRAMMTWDADARRELRPVLRPVAELPG